MKKMGEKLSKSDESYLESCKKRDTILQKIESAQNDAEKYKLWETHEDEYNKLEEIVLKREFENSKTIFKK